MEIKKGGAHLSWCIRRERVEVMIYYRYAWLIVRSLIRQRCLLSVKGEPRIRGYNSGPYM
jgi:hypothetical protein